MSVRPISQPKVIFRLQLVGIPFRLVVLKLDGHHLLVEMQDVTTGWHHDPGLKSVIRRYANSPLGNDLIIMNHLFSNYANSALVDDYDELVIYQ
jgi:hypothetical protein